MPKLIDWVFTAHEEQSGRSRVDSAERLICQLPLCHEGRNTWLMNYGFGIAAERLREARNIGPMDEETQALPNIERTIYEGQSR